MLLIGQTPQIAPLDKKLYALRDVTGTVESIPLIASSIMSKKLAEGIDGLILDLKIGGGAFMKNMESGRKLAHTMKEIGSRFNTKVDVLFTDMNEPLGFATGNSLEIIESIEVMKGGYVPQVTELVLRMAATLMVSFKIAESIESGEKTALEKLKSGAVAQRFAKTVELQGGDVRVIDNPEKVLPSSKLRKDIYAQQSGFIEKIDALSFGKALVQLGGGRLRKEDGINYGAGFIFSRKKGDAVKKGDLLYTVFYDDESRLSNAMNYLSDAVSFCESAPSGKSVILDSA
jgi:pyrimidine-nucleoside phosphorylase